MVSEVCQETIRLMGKYLQPLAAQIYLERYCHNVGSSMDMFAADDIGYLVLYIATHRDEIRVDDRGYNRLVEDLVHLSRVAEENRRIGLHGPAIRGGAS